LAARGRGRDRRSLGAARSLSRVDACNPLLQAHLTWARDEHEGRGIPTSLTPKKVRRVVRFRILFLFSSFSLLQQGPGKGDTLKRILPREGTRLRASLLIRGSKAGPPEGFDSRLRARGPYTHYWLEVRRPAPRKGSTAASGYSGSAPITDQGFEGWPPKGSQPPQTPSEG
jgi:hypothetical protein